MDFSIIKYYLESYGSEDYSYMKMRKGMLVSLLTKVGIMLPRMMLAVANNIENSSWLYWSHGSQ